VTTTTTTHSRLTVHHTATAAHTPWELREDDGGVYAISDHERTARAMADRINGERERAARVKLTVSANPNANRRQYQDRAAIDGTPIGTVGVTSYPEDMPSTRHYLYRDSEAAPGTYTVTIHTRDIVTIRGKQHEDIHITMTARGDGDEPFTRPHARTYRGTLTDAARDVLALHGAAIIRQWVADQGGAAAVKKAARNAWRRDKIAYRQADIDRLTDERDTLAAQLEA
jgi:hypothetical protein